MAFDYADELPREWILALKHRSRPDLAEPLGALLAERWEGWREEASDPVAFERPRFVAVPVHPLRRLERGYDQAVLLARAVARRVGGRFHPALRRTRWSAPQGAPGSVSRAANVRGAFRLGTSAREELSGRWVWLVDDVVVSGASVRACREALRPARPAGVAVLALARAAERA